MTKTDLKKSKNVKASTKSRSTAKVGAKAKSRTGVKPVAKIDRHEMIAIEAYLRAERRSFSGGDPMRDWLEAEKQVDAVLNDLSTKSA